MLLVQKQPNLPSSPAPHHRRHPSAPSSVVVQATRTPGLLSLSKPPKPFPARPQQVQNQNQQRIRSTPKPKSAARPQPPASTTAAPLTLAHADNADARTPSKKAFTPEKGQSRGRQHPKPQKPARSASQSPHRNGRRSNNRQPSPQLPDHLIDSSPAEVPPTPAKNKADPFVDDSPAAKSSSPPISYSAAPPTLSSRPTGKLARRRQQHQQLRDAPSTTSEITMTVSQNAKPIDIQSLPRSGPRLIPTSQRAKENTPVFPICDDTDEALYPITPTRPRYKNNAQQSKIPLPQMPAVHGYFPNVTSSLVPAALNETPKRRARHHKRAPSGGVFDMSSDEDVPPPSSASNGALTPNVEALFNGFAPQRRGSFSSKGPIFPGSGLPSSLPLPSALSAFDVPQPVTMPRTRESREKQLEREAAAAVAAYFASSNFQNSPSPDELPPPDF